MRFNQLLRGTASVAVLSAFAAGAAHAQSAPKAGDQQEATSVSELVVTAQKREQNLQDVPVVVTTLSAKTLQGAGVKDIKDMQILTPGLTVTSTQSETITTARIRGVGTVGDNPGLESSVGVVIDGVYRPRNGVSFGDLGEMQRIEVLKGPQGTLFGKNTSAGVINVMTKAPSFTFGAEGEATFGNYGQKGGSIAVTGPITDKLAGRIYFADRQRDGFYDVNTGVGPRTDKEDQDQHYWTARGQLLFQPSDTVNLRLIADYTKRDEHCCVAVQTRTGPTGAIVNGLAAGNGVASPADPFDRLAYANRPTDQKITDKGVSLQADIDLPFGATLTSISAVRGWDSTNGQDIDYSGADILYRDPNGHYGTDFTTISQEVRLAGATKHLDWMVGGFFADEDMKHDDSYSFGSAYNPFISLLLTSGASPAFIPCLTGSFGVIPVPAPHYGCFGNGPSYQLGEGVHDRYDQNAKSLAFFTNETWKITDALNLTVGLRYTNEEKKLDSRYANVGANGNVCAAALGNTGLNWGSLGLGAAQQQQAVGVLCLPWANPYFNNVVTSQKMSGDNVSGTAKLSYRWSQDVMTYVSYARGYKAGGFNLDRIQSSNGLPSGAPGVAPVTDTSFPAETVDSYELGAKTTWLNGKLLLNAAIFDQKYKHFQLNTFLGTSFVVESIPELESKGVDADFVWFTPMKGVSLQGGVTYADTTYGNFTAADLIAPSHFPQLSLLPGGTMSFAPKWSSSIALNVDRSIGYGLRGVFNLAAKYQSDYNTGSDLIPFKMQDAYTLVNGRIGIGSENGRWMVEFWGQNLTNADYKQVVFNGPLQGTAFQSTPQPNGTYYNKALDTQTYDAFLGQPRTYGVTLRVRY